MEEIVILILLVAGAIVFIASFFKKDRIEGVENQMENLSITLMQELYKVKKKQNELEEEVMIHHHRD
ncbi:MAG TPA: hypothetical protein VFK33_11000 [Bacillales bacterium]|nr:hypothetical protein [Bacillales bacterium]